MENKLPETGRARMKMLVEGSHDEEEEEKTSYESLTAKLTSMKREDRDEYNSTGPRTRQKTRWRKWKSNREINIEDAQEETGDILCEDVGFEDGMREHFRQKESYLLCLQRLISLKKWLVEDF